MFDTCKARHLPIAGQQSVLVLLALNMDKCVSQKLQDEGFSLTLLGSTCLVFMFSVGKGLVINLFWFYLSKGLYSDEKQNIFWSIPSLCGSRQTQFVTSKDHKKGGGVTVTGESYRGKKKLKARQTAFCKSHYSEYFVASVDFFNSKFKIWNVCRV